MPLFVEKIIRKAQSHEKAGETFEAEALYKQVLAKFPKNKKAIVGYQKLKAGVSSISTKEIEPPHNQIRELIEQYNQGKFKSLLFEIKDLINLFPKATVLYNIEGSVHDALQNYRDAVNSYKISIKIKPECAETFFNLGNTYKNMENFGEAIDSYKKAIKLEPSDAEAYSNMGNSYYLKGDLDFAIKSYKKAIEIKPDFFISYNNIGEALKDKGELDTAIENYKKAIEISPDYAEAYTNMGNAFKDKGNLRKAIENYKWAIKVKPEYLEAYNNMGNTLLDKGDTDQAIKIFEQALLIKADYAEVLNGMGTAMCATGDYKSAINYYRNAIKVTPDFVKAYINLGVALKDNGEIDAALESFKQALKIQPDHAETHFSLGVFLQEKGDIDEAFKSYKKALKINPIYAAAYFNMGNMYESKGELNDAMESYKQALKVQPNYALAISNLVYMMNLYGFFSNQERFFETCSYTQALETPFALEKPHFNNSRDPDRNLQIGFVSGDFLSHPISVYCLKLFAQLCKYPNLTMHAYYTRDTVDFVTLEIKKCFYEWNNVKIVSDQLLTDQIIADKIDILIDLSNHSKGNRLGTFARKPAPVQVTALGLPYTTGLKAIDYYFGAESERWEKRFFSECLLEMPTTTAYNFLYATPDVNDLPAVNNGFITFGSCNTVSRINRACITLWAKLLREMPESRFVFAGQKSQFMQDKFKEWFTEENVDLSRIDFLSRKSTEEYMSIYHQIDVHLVLHPMAGLTTISDALYMGVPSLGLSSIEDEAGVEILDSLGLEDFFLKNEEDFISKGRSLANEMAVLADIRKNLRNRFTGSLSCNSGVAAAGWEAALRIIWKRWCSNLDPEPIKLKLDDLRYLPS